MRGVPDFIVERQIQHWTLDDTVDFFNLISGTLARVTSSP